MQMIWLMPAKGGIWMIPASTTRAMIAGAAQSLQDRPMDTARIRVALYQLWLLTKHEKMEVEDREAMLSIYVKKLSSYPETAVMLVIEELTESSIFFPAWADLAKRLDSLFALRSGITNALRRVAMRIKE